MCRYAQGDSKSVTDLLSFFIHLFFGQLVGQVTRRNMLLPPGTSLHNRYVIAKVHEQGQESAVYLAYDEAEDRDVAIKENTHADQAHCRQFELEATMLSNLSHPSIPRALDYFIEDRVQFLVMDFLEGFNLQQVVQRRQPATPEILDWAAQLCDILTFLHSLRPSVVHGDVEPANLILGQDGQIFLVDFGAAQVYAPGSGGTMTAAGMRTAQVTDPRDDQYCVAATLYALFTGA